MSRPFNGSPDYMELASTTGVTGASGFTASVWLKPTPAANGTVFGYGYSSSAGSRWALERRAATSVHGAVAQPLV